MTHSCSDTNSGRAQGLTKDLFLDLLARTIPLITLLRPFQNLELMNHDSAFLSVSNWKFIFESTTNQSDLKNNRFMIEIIFKTLIFILFIFIYNNKIFYIA